MLAETKLGKPHLNRLDKVFKKIHLALYAPELRKTTEKNEGNTERRKAAGSDGLERE
jgi:hypothetical protein